MFDGASYLLWILNLSELLSFFFTCFVFFLKNIYKKIFKSQVGVGRDERFHGSTTLQGLKDTPILSLLLFPLPRCGPFATLTAH